MSVIENDIRVSLQRLEEKLACLIRQNVANTHASSAIAEATIAVNDDSGTRIAVALERIAHALEGPSPPLTELALVA